MNHNRLTSALCLAAASVCAIALTACGSSDSATSTKGEPTVVGLSNSNVDSVWRPQMLKDFEAEATTLKQQGKIKDFMVQNADGTAPKQAQQIQTMVNQGANLILIDAASADALNGVAEKAMARGVTVVSFDNPISSKKTVNLYQDEQKISGQTAETLAQLIKGTGTVVMMNGTAGAPLSDAREKIASGVFAKYPGIKVISEYADWNGATAKQKMSTVLANNPDIAAVWSQGSMAPSIASAFQDQNIPLPPIMSDGLGGFLQTWGELKKQRNYQTVGIVVSPKIVLDALWAGVKLRDGWKMKDREPVLSHELITNDNLDKYLALDTPAGSHIDVPIVSEQDLYSQYMVQSAG